MTPVKHSQSSANKWGGDWEDYIEIHNWFDETKQFTGNWTHRALRHHSAGVEWCINQFGHAIKNSDGILVPVKMIAEQHVTEDCGFIPQVSDWFGPLLNNPGKWMLSVGSKVVESTFEVK